MKKILFVTSEVYPLIKTGGLADVSGSLPIALKALGHDVRILIPGYPSALAQGAFELVEAIPGTKTPKLQQSVLPGTQVPVLAFIDDTHFGRPGNPYLGPEGSPWPDNAERFAAFCHVATDLAMDRLGLNWTPDVVHCNDWQTGLVPALLNDEIQRPATVFTLHNLAYQGTFSHDTFLKLRLPLRFWSPHALEFYGQMSFIKGGLVFADRLSTVSPTYARDIQGTEFGCGLEGLLSHRSAKLSGILNGIDMADWNPASDPYLPVHFDQDHLEHRQDAKAALQTAFGLPLAPKVPLLAWVGRLVEQKGIDLLIDLLPRLMALPLQIVLIGSGDSRFEQSLQHWTKLFPDQFALKVGYDEARARLVEAGSDVFLMPSRFEPCGLNQMYSQRYGAIPLVRRAGGLADTVVDADAHTLKEGTATGLLFEEATPEAFYDAIERALALYEKPEVWRGIQKTGMARDFSWEFSAQRYVELYAEADIDRQSAHG